MWFWLSVVMRNWTERWFSEEKKINLLLVVIDKRIVCAEVPSCPCCKPHRELKIWTVLICAELFTPVCLHQIILVKHFSSSVFAVWTKMLLIFSAQHITTQHFCGLDASVQNTYLKPLLHPRQLWGPSPLLLFILDASADVWGITPISAPRKLSEMLC